MNMSQNCGKYGFIARNFIIFKDCFYFIYPRHILNRISNKCLQSERLLNGSISRSFLGCGLLEGTLAMAFEEPCSWWFNRTLNFFIYSIWALTAPVNSAKFWRIAFISNFFLLVRKMIRSKGHDQVRSKNKVLMNENTRNWRGGKYEK